MKGKTHEHTASLTALLLFAVFALCVLSVLLAGAGSYRRLTARDESAYQWRTCQQYLAAKVRQSDAAGGVSAAPFGGGTALVLAQQIEGETYLTRVYCHDGWLMELFSSGTADPAPEDGERLVPLDGLGVSLDGRTLTLTLTGTDGTRTLQLTLRSGEGAAR